MRLFCIAMLLLISAILFAPKYGYDKEALFLAAVFVWLSLVWASVVVSKQVFK